MSDDKEQKSPMAGLLGGLVEAMKKAEERDIFNLPVQGAFYRDGMLEPGTFVKVRPANPKHEGKTFIGLFLGELAINAAISVSKTDKADAVIVLKNNPAIFVPKLKQIVFGIESWWGKIKPEDAEEISQITDDDIANVWYVKALKAQLEAQKAAADAE